MSCRPRLATLTMIDCLLTAVTLGMLRSITTPANTLKARLEWMKYEVDRRCGHHGKKRTTG
jgi:hypothetical protein